VKFDDKKDLADGMLCCGGRVYPGDASTPVGMTVQCGVSLNFRVNMFSYLPYIPMIIGRG